MRVPLVAGNWKMNGTLSSIAPLLDGICRGIASVQRAEVCVCPPFVYLDHTANRLADTRVGIAAQDLSQQPSGAYTGEVCGEMLADYGCTRVIVGHSERRGLYLEDDGLVAEKFARAIELGIAPILCVGETLAERELGHTEQVVERQLGAVLAHNGIASFRHAVVAYEPVWAIGTGKTATPEQAQSVHATIREQLAKGDPEVADGLRILYGGSVKAENAQTLFAMPDIDGGLIGGASLDAEDFLTICRAAG